MEVSSQEKYKPGSADLDVAYEGTPAIVLGIDTPADVRASIKRVTQMRKELIAYAQSQEGGMHKMRNEDNMLVPIYAPDTEVPAKLEEDPNLLSKFDRSGRALVDVLLDLRSYLLKQESGKKLTESEEAFINGAEVKIRRKLETFSGHLKRLEDVLGVSFTLREPADDDEDTGPNDDPLGGENFVAVFDDAGAMMEGMEKETTNAANGSGAHGMRDAIGLIRAIENPDAKAEKERLHARLSELNKAALGLPDTPELLGKIAGRPKDVESALRRLKQGRASVEEVERALDEYDRAVKGDTEEPDSGVERPDTSEVSPDALAHRIALIESTYSAAVDQGRRYPDSDLLQQIQDISAQLKQTPDQAELEKLLTKIGELEDTLGLQREDQSLIEQAVPALESRFANYTSLVDLIPDASPQLLTNVAVAHRAAHDALEILKSTPERSTRDAVLQAFEVLKNALEEAGVDVPPEDEVAAKTKQESQKKNQQDGESDKNKKESLEAYKAGFEEARQMLERLRNERNTLKEKAGRSGVDLLHGEYAQPWARYKTELDALGTMIPKLRTLLSEIENGSLDETEMSKKFDELKISMQNFGARTDFVKSLREQINFTGTDVAVVEQRDEKKDAKEKKEGNKNEKGPTVAERQKQFMDALYAAAGDPALPGGVLRGKLIRFLRAYKEPILMDDGTEMSAEDVASLAHGILDSTQELATLKHESLRGIINDIREGRVPGGKPEDDVEAGNVRQIAETRLLENLSSKERQVDPELYKSVVAAREAYLASAQQNLRSRKEKNSRIHNFFTRLQKGDDHNLSQEVGLKYQEYLRTLEAYKAAIADRLNARGDERVEKWTVLFDSLDTEKKKKRLMARGATEEEIAQIDALPEADRAAAMRTLFQEKTKDRLESKVDGIAYSRNILKELQAQQEGAIQARQEVWSEEKNKAFEKTKAFLVRNKKIVKWGIRGAVLGVAAWQGAGQAIERIVAMGTGVAVGGLAMAGISKGLTPIERRINAGMLRRARSAYSLQNKPSDTAEAFQKLRAARTTETVTRRGKEAAVLGGGAIIAMWAAGELGDRAEEQFDAWVASLSEADPDIPLGADDFDEVPKISEMPDDLAEPLRASEPETERPPVDAIEASPYGELVFEVTSGDNVWNIMKEQVASQHNFPAGSQQELVFLDTIDDYLQALTKAAAEGDMSARNDLMEMKFREVNGVYDANKIYPEDKLDFTLLEERGVFDRALAAAESYRDGNAGAASSSVAEATSSATAEAPTAPEEPAHSRPEPRPEAGLSDAEVADRLYRIASGSMRESISEIFGDTSHSAYARLQGMSPQEFFDYARPAIGGGGNFMASDYMLSEAHPFLNADNVIPLGALYQGVMEYAASYGFSPQQVVEMANSLPANENMEGLMYEIAHRSASEAYAAGALPLDGAAETTAAPETFVYTFTNGAQLDIPAAEMDALQAQWNSATQESIDQYIGDTTNNPAGRFLNAPSNANWSAPKILMESFREEAVSGFSKVDLQQVAKSAQMLRPEFAGNLEALHSAVIDAGKQYGFSASEISEFAKAMPKEATVHDLFERMAQEATIRTYAASR